MILTPSIPAGGRVQVAAAVIDAFHQNETLSLAGSDFFTNEFILLRDEQNPKHTGIGRAISSQVVAHLNPEYENAWNIHSRSKEQRMALELLLNPDINLVTLIGRAGTGKTMLALAAGLELVLHLESLRKAPGFPPHHPHGQGYWLSSRYKR